MIRLLLILLVVSSAAVYAQELRLKSYDSSGSGYVSNAVQLNNGLIVTCTHCVNHEGDKLPGFHDVYINGPVKVATVGEGVTILKGNKTAKVAVLATELPKAGEIVTQRCWFHGEREERLLRWIDDEACAVAGKKVDYKYNKPSTFVFQHGMSGSGIYNSKNELVGIVQDVAGGIWSVKDINKVLNLLSKERKKIGFAQR